VALPAAFAQQQREVPYRTVIEGVTDTALAEAITGASTLAALEDERPPTATGLVRRAQADIDRTLTALRSFGHYDGRVTLTIAGFALSDPALEDRLAAATEPVEVRLAVEPGPLYRISRFDIVGPGGTAPQVRIDRTALGLAVGDPAASRAIINAGDALLAQARSRGYPFASLDRDAVVDHAARSMELTLTLDPGERANFGQIAVAGLDRVDRRTVVRRAPFERGDRYDPERLEDFRREVSALDVFSSVRVETGPALDAEGQVPVTVTVVERPRRFFGFGADYATTEGFGIRAHWGHRNLFGGAESVRLDAGISRLGENSVDQLNYNLGITFRKPDIFVARQDFVASASLVEEHFDAYDRSAALAQFGIERSLSEKLDVGAALSFEYSDVTDQDGTNTYTLVGLPVFARYDNTDDLLDPTEGLRLDARFWPYPAALGSSTDIYISKVVASTYYDFETDGRAILAGRLAVGALFGSETNDVPADKRFYAGGGGSIRGYAFQSVGPLDANNEPLGGRSLFEASVELRYRITPTIGVVGFLDTGSAFDASLPDFSEDLQYAAGIGGRYFTGFGPIRVDFAFPLNPREEDDAFAFYISLGQAF
jgi:translocation and assembly module TamA